MKSTELIAAMERGEAVSVSRSSGAAYIRGAAIRARTWEAVRSRLYPRLIKTPFPHRIEYTLAPKGTP